MAGKVCLSVYMWDVCDDGWGNCQWRIQGVQQVQIQAHQKNSFIAYFEGIWAYRP